MFNSNFCKYRLGGITMKKLLLVSLLVSCTYAKEFQDLPPAVQVLQHIDGQLKMVKGNITDLDLKEWVPMMLKRLPLQAAQEKLNAQTQLLAGLSRDIQSLEEELQHAQVHQITCGQVRSLESRLKKLQKDAQQNLSSGKAVIKIEHDQASWVDKAAQMLRGNLPHQISSLLHNYVTTLTNMSAAISRIIHILACE